MKFGKYWKSEVLKLPIDIQSKCISYKDWKEKSSSLRNADSVCVNQALNNLKVQVFNTDKSFKWLLTRDETFLASLIELFVPCCGKLNMEKIYESHKWAYHYARLNTVCLSKICKRVDKISRTKLFSSWLIKVKEEHKYSFLGGKDVTILEMKYGTSDHREQECPICLDDICKYRIVLNCGHVLCMTCVKRMLKVPHASNKFNETDYFLMQYSQQSHAKDIVCPCCRCENAFFHITVLKH